MATDATGPGKGSPFEVLIVALRLGLTSFGGPIAHLGYFRREYVEKRAWLDDAAYADLVALAQFLPGPASSQVGIAIGLHRAGGWGGLAAWLGFTLPSAILMVALAAMIGQGIVVATGPLLTGLQIAAVAVVAQAVVTMGWRLTPDLPRLLVAAAAAGIVLAFPTAASQAAVMIGGALIGYLVLRETVVGDGRAATVAPIGRLAGSVAGVAFAVLLVGLPLLAALTAAHAIDLADAFYRPGALVFGGGHVVLPLLETSVVAPGWVSSADFVAGYGAAQALPGPLFTISAYLGAIAEPVPNGLPGAIIALGAMFLPGGLILIAGLAAWDRLRAAPGIGRALAGVNAAVVGILLAALWDPVITTAIRSPIDALVAVAAFVILMTGRVAPILVVAGCAAAGLVLPA